MDPRTFDGMIRQLSRALSRRSLVGGSLGAAVLTAVGLVGDTHAKKSRAEDCLPPGQRCGTRKKDPPCRKCCQGYHVENSNGAKKCACRPNGVECNNSSQCCAGTCEGGLCRPGTPAPCVPAGSGCTNPTQCCTGICEVGVCRTAPCRAVDTNCAVDLDCCSGVCGCIEEFPGISFCTCRRSDCVLTGGECTSTSACCTEECGDDGSGAIVCLPP